ncbi:MAG: class I SAM-dependent methyltransferase [Betaproteobacteria bacterium]|nr:class I SAM-dependent methyltransferase [Betaproteobacteria bacterium]
MPATEAQRSNPHQALVPAPWVVRFAPLINPGGRVLDLACGYGRHARFLAALGHPVLAVDRDEAALATLAAVAGIETQVADLEQGSWPFGRQRFDAIVVTHYLHRPLLADLLAALQPDGVLIYETFADGNAAFGRPARPEFLLQRDELLQRVQGLLRVVAFEQGQVEVPFPAVIERICATGVARAWPTALPPAP